MTNPSSDSCDGTEYPYSNISIKTPPASPVHPVVVGSTYSTRRNSNVCECRSALEEEAVSAVREFSFAVQTVCISEILPRTSDLLFLNLTTLEGSTYCIELTSKGWRIASNRQDCMNGDFRQLSLHTRYFESLNQLLDTISPAYRDKFDSSLAAMSIDLGSQFIKVGLVKPGTPMEIVLNKESRRKTPNLLSIRNGERLFGDAALATSVRYPSSVFGSLVDLVAKHIDHPSVILFQKRFAHLKIEKHTNKSSIIFPIGLKTLRHLTCIFRDEAYPVETLLAMILSHIRDFTASFAEHPVKDVVITVPVFFSQAERLAVEKAAHIAKLNVLQLINDGTAAGLNYGVFRRKEITETPQRLLIYDMGASKTVATIVEYRLVKEKYSKEPRVRILKVYAFIKMNQNIIVLSILFLKLSDFSRQVFYQMSVLGVGFDRTLGGLEITLRLKDFLIRKFRANYKCEKDITENERAMAKMLKEAERLKQVLSANVDHYAQIESVHEDKDMRIHVSRNELNMLIEDLVPRMKLPIDQALSMAEIRLEDVNQVVLMGAGTRVLKVQEVVQNHIGSKELGRFLNTDESIAMGALFQSISFTSYTDDFSFELDYGDLNHFSEIQRKEMDSLISQIFTVSVSGLDKAIKEKVKTDETEFKGVKVAFQLDGSGIIRVQSGEAVIQKKSQGVVECLYIFMYTSSAITNTISGFFSTKKEEGEPTDTDEKKDEEPIETLSDNGDKPNLDIREEKNSEEVGEKYSESDQEQKNESVTEDKTAEKYTTAHIMDKNDMDSAKKILDHYEKREQLAAERAAAENSLEAFAFETSLLLDEDSFISHSTDDERKELFSEVSRIRTWLEDETGTDTKASEFTKNLMKIKNLVKPVQKRIDESKTFLPALSNLEKMLNSSRIMASMGGDNGKTLFSKNDTKEFNRKLNKLENWILIKKEEQMKTKPYHDPTVLTSDVETKVRALDRELKSFMKKMKQVTLDVPKMKNEKNEVEENEITENKKDNENNVNNNDIGSGKTDGSKIEL
uniref:DUF727 domain-containing protein n=1 Tax=Heterorhabditis bacteriophora TaxID=37862 RepID=A0A1I7XTM9_HETBA